MLAQPVLKISQPVLPVTTRRNGSMNYPAPQGSRSHKSRISNSRIVFPALAAFVLLLAASSAMWSPRFGARTAMAAAINGAIYTSDKTGLFVNLNQYDAKCDVYL